MKQLSATTLSATLALCCACGSPTPSHVPQPATVTTPAVTDSAPPDDETPYVLPALPADVPGDQNLTLRGTGYPGGSTLHTALVAPSSRVLATQDVAVNANGTFSVSFAHGVAKGVAYQVAMYVDTNGNGFCNTAPLDSSWRIAVPTITSDTGDTEVDAPVTSTAAAVCEAFGAYNLSFTGVAFQLHEGLTLYVDLVDRADGTRVGEVQQQVITHGRAEYGWRTLLVPGHSYILAYFSDTNANKTCDALPVDHQWVQVLSNVAADAVITGKHADAQQPACPDMPSGVIP